MQCWKRELSLLSIVTVCAAVLISGGIAEALAEPFRNLGFEAAVVDAGTPVGFEMPASKAMPYWTTIPAGWVLYDNMALDATAISIHDALSPFFKPLAGNYTVLLQDGYDEYFKFQNAWISQTGNVPSSSRSLMFSSDSAQQYLDHLVVSLDGTAIPMQLYSVGNTINPSWGPIKTFIGDISAFAGRTNVELRFEKVAAPPLHGAVHVDSITFSTTVAPEPSSLVLLTIGIFSLAGYYWRRRNEQRGPSNIG